MRTMSFAIIIHNDEINQSLPGLVRDDNLHEYINPGNTDQPFCNNKEDQHRSSCNWPKIQFDYKELMRHRRRIALWFLISVESHSDTTLLCT